MTASREKDRREIIRPQLGEAVVVTLSCKEPQEVQGIDGPQWMYSVNANSGMMYASKIGHQAIQASGAQQGDTIRILRSYGKWDVEIVEIYEDEPTQTAPPNRGRPDSALQSKPPANGAAQPRRSPKEQTASRPSYADVMAEPVSQAEPEAPTQSYPLAEQLLPFLRGAMIACEKAQDEARQNGIQFVEFGTKDVCSLAITLFIQHAKGGH